MMWSLRKASSSGLPTLLQDDIHDLESISAEEYLSNLTRYFKNITIVLIRQRPSDLIPLDTWTGIAWVMIVPVIYFAAVALILGSLFLYFWHLDRTRLVSASQSEASVVSAAVNSLRHDTVVVKDATVNSLHHSVFRSYLINDMELNNMFKTSEGSRGSTRSLGVLTDKDLQLTSFMAASNKSKGFTKRDIRRSHSIQECADQRRSSCRKFNSRLNCKSRGSLQSETSSRSELRMADIVTVSSRNSSPLSIDSLEEEISRDNLRASMESHKMVGMANGEIGPEDLYGSTKVASESDRSSNIASINMNTTTASVAYTKPVTHKQNCTHQLAFCENDTDEFLKKIYHTAMSSDIKAKTPTFGTRLDNLYKEATESTLTSVSMDAHFSGNHLCRPQIAESTPLSHSLQQDKVQTRGVSIANAGTNVHTNYPEINNASESQIEVQNVRWQHFNTSSFRGSPALKSCESYPENGVDENHSTYHVQHHDHNQWFETEEADLNISSVSQMGITSSDDPDYAQDSEGSNVSERDGSAADSLPSSIARFHSSNVGQFPAPTAGYPLPSTRNAMLDLTLESDCSKADYPYDDGQASNLTGGSSVSATFGSFTPSTEALFSRENSLHPSQEGRNSTEDKSQLEQRTIKLSKRPSPLSSFVHNFRQRYSFDENLLFRCRRGESDEEEAIIRSPLIQQEARSQRCQSLDLKREKVTVEQRLEEFGFLKANGKNRFVINPSPGKFETGAGYSNHVFKNSQDTCSNVRSGVDVDDELILFLDMQHQTRNKDVTAEMTQNGKDRYKEHISQLLERSTYAFQEPRRTDHNYLQHDEKKSDLKYTDSIGVLVERQVIEIHDEATPIYTEVDLEQVGSEAGSNTRDLSQCVLDLSDCRERETFNGYGLGAASYYKRNVLTTHLGKCHPQLYGEDEPTTYTPFSKFREQPVGYDDLKEFITGNKAQVNERSDAGQSMCTNSRKSNHVTITPRTNGNSVVERGRRLTRQHTSRALNASLNGSFTL